jgi:pilus assembly protein Flp/PilA
VNPRLCPHARQSALGRVHALLSDRNGAMAMEYGLIAALIALVILGSIKALGVSLGGLPLAAIVAALS